MVHINRISKSVVPCFRHHWFDTIWFKIETTIDCICKMPTPKRFKPMVQQMTPDQSYSVSRNSNHKQYGARTIHLLCTCLCAHVLLYFYTSVYLQDCVTTYKYACANSHIFSFCK